MKVSSLAGKKSSGKAVWIAVAAVCVLIALAAGWFYLAVYPYSTPEKTATRYFDAITHGNGKALVACLSSKHRAAAKDLPERAFQLPPGSPTAKVQFVAGKATVTGETAIVPVSFKMPGMTGQFGLENLIPAMKLALVKEGMTWRIEMEETGRLMMESSRQLMEKLAKKYPGQLPAPGFSAPPAPPGR